MAKINNLPASAYAKPHNNPVVSGRPVPSGERTTPTRVSGPQPSTFPVKPAGECDNKEYMRKMNVSVANSHSNDYPPTKTDGIKIRGTGAATKGLMARGPMA